MTIEYRLDPALTPEQFTELLRSSTLGARRPVDDPACMRGMVENSNLLVSAWDGELPVGVARSVTDFHYACYLSDLAVRESHQRLGIGRELLRQTQSRLGPQCRLILLAAPAADDYYRRLGLHSNPRGWVLEPGQLLR